MHEIVCERANEGEGGRARKRIGSRGLGLNQSPHGRRGDEHHAQEKKAAPEEDRGEELVFLLPQAIAQHAEEPEEGNAGEGQEAQGERHIAGRLLQPEAGVARVDGQRAPEQRQACNEQHRENDPGDSRRARRPQPGVNQGRMWGSRIA